MDSFELCDPFEHGIRAAVEIFHDRDSVAHWLVDSTFHPLSTEFSARLAPPHGQAASFPDIFKSISLFPLQPLFSLRATSAQLFPVGKGGTRTLSLTASAEACDALGDEKTDPLKVGLIVPGWKAAELVTLAVSRMLSIPTIPLLATLSLRSRSDGSVKPSPRPCSASGSEPPFGAGSTWLGSTGTAVVGLGGLRMSRTAAGLREMGGVPATLVSAREALDKLIRSKTELLMLYCVLSVEDGSR